MLEDWKHGMWEKWKDDRVACRNDGSFIFANCVNERQSASADDVFPPGDGRGAKCSFVGPKHRSSRPTLGSVNETRPALKGLRHMLGILLHHERRIRRECVPCYSSAIARSRWVDENADRNPLIIGWTRNCSILKSSKKMPAAERGWAV